MRCFLHPIKAVKTAPSVRDLVDAIEVHLLNDVKPAAAVVDAQKIFMRLSSALASNNADELRDLLRKMAEATKP